jgi:hypothetical protein
LGLDPVSANLDRFWRVYSERRACGLVAAGVFDVSRPSFPEVGPIVIHNVIRREAWQVKTAMVEDKGIKR